MQVQYIAVMFGGIAAAGYDHSILPGTRNAIGHGMRQLPRFFPLAIGPVKHIDLIIPGFNPAIPGIAVFAEVGTARHQQSAVRYAGVSSGQPNLIRNGS